MRKWVIALTSVAFVAIVWFFSFAWLGEHWQPRAPSAAIMPEAISFSPPSAPSRFTSNQGGTASQRITPAIRVESYNDPQSNITLLIVRLSHPRLEAMTPYDLYTVRLWLFDNEWRLLNRSVIGVLGSYSRDSVFTPRNAHALFQGATVIMVFAVPSSLLQQSASLLLTGGIRNSPGGVSDIEILVRKSRLIALRQKPKLPKVRSLMKVVQQVKPAPCRWRYWVIEHPSKEVRSANEVQRGAWGFCGLAFPAPKTQARKSGWSQLLLWHETDNLKETTTFSACPIGRYIDLCYRTDDPNTELTAVARIVIELTAESGRYICLEKASGVAYQPPYDYTLKSLDNSYIGNLSPTKRLSLDIGIPFRQQLNIPKSWETPLSRHSFSTSASTSITVFSSTNPIEITSSNFILVRVNATLELKGKMGASSDPKEFNRVALYMNMPYLTLHCQGRSAERRLCFATIDF
mgnify:CR=1 FL=1